MKKDADRDIEHYLSTGGLMHVLEISRSTVYRLMAKEIPNIKVGSVHRFSMEQVFEMVEGELGRHRGPIESQLALAVTLELHLRSNAPVLGKRVGVRPSDWRLFTEI